MTFTFETLDTATANAQVRDNSFVTLLDGADSPFTTLEIGKTVKFAVPASNADEIKTADKLKKDIGDHIRLIRDDVSPRVESKDDDGKRTFYVTVTKRIVRKKDSEGK